MVVQHFVLGMFAYLFVDFGSLLKKLLFLGRTLLLRLWVLGTHVRKRLGRLGEQPEQLGASNSAGTGMLAPGLANLCWRSISCSAVCQTFSNPVLVQECCLQG